MRRGWPPRLDSTYTESGASTCPRCRLRLACRRSPRRVTEVFQRLSTLKPTALGAEELSPEDPPGVQVL